MKKGLKTVLTLCLVLLMLLSVTGCQAEPGETNLFTEIGNWFHELWMNIANWFAQLFGMAPAEPTEPTEPPTEPATPPEPHTCSYTEQGSDATHHYMKCACGKIDESTKEAHSATSDNDCETAEVCACGYTVTAAKDHVADADDGNCTTAQGCVNCAQVAVAGKEHTDSDHDYICDNDGCQVTVGNPPKDENEGIDLPVDRN